MCKSSFGIGILCFVLLCHIISPSCALGDALKGKETIDSVEYLSLSSSVLSPDKTKVVFVVDHLEITKDKPHSGISRENSFWWSRIDQPGAELVTKEPLGGLASWSPDSNTLVFATAQVAWSDEYALLMYDTERKLLRPLIEEGQDYLPQFSPVKEDMIGFIRHSEKGDGLYLLEIPTGIQVQLTPDAVTNGRWDWGRDGEEIYYCAGTRESALVRAVHMTSHEVRNIFAFTGNPKILCALPDNQTFCLTTSSGEIYLFKKDGSLVKEMHSMNIFYGGMSWLNAETVAFYFLDRERGKWSLALSENALSSFKILKEDVSFLLDVDGINDTNWRLGWVSPETILYGDQYEITLIDKNGKRISSIFAINEGAHIGE